MKFETLKSFNKKKLIIPTIIICSIIIVVTLFISHSKYIYKDSITIIDGTVNYKPYDFKIVEMYIEKDNEYEEIETMPELGYVINQELSYCYVDDENIKIKEKVYTNEEGEHIIKELPKRSKCIIYFDSKSKHTLNLLGLSSRGKANITGSSCLNGTNETFSNTKGEQGNCDLQENGIYEAPDDYGTSYYFRGTVNNNWFKFGKMGKDNTGADIWWRIIRINGDGTLRLLYAGEGTNAPASEDGYYMTSLGINNGQKVAFNTIQNFPLEVGYMYGTQNSASEEHSNINDSDIKKVIDTWYETNLIDDDMIISRNTGFCGDRNIGDEGYREYLIFKPYERVIALKPSLKCPNKENDLYTTPNNINNGNEALKYPIALITIDEVALAGWYHGTYNLGFYLKNSTANDTDAVYWTMSPGALNTGKGTIFGVSRRDNFPGDWYTTLRKEIKPVININISKISGSGISTDPFRLS